MNMVNKVETHFKGGNEFLYVYKGYKSKQSSNFCCLKHD